jgi:hypothetical protein
MRSLPFWAKGFIYSFLCIFTLTQISFGQGPAAASAYGKLPLSFEPAQGQASSATGSNVQPGCGGCNPNGAISAD